MLRRPPTLTDPPSSARLAWELRTTWIAVCLGGFGVWAATSLFGIGTVAEAVADTPTPATETTPASPRWERIDMDGDGPDLWRSCVGGVSVFYAEKGTARSGLAAVDGCDE